MWRPVLIQPRLALLWLVSLLINHYGIDCCCWAVMTVNAREFPRSQIRAMLCGHFWSGIFSPCQHQSPLVCVNKNTNVSKLRYMSVTDLLHIYRIGLPILTFNGYHQHGCLAKIAQLKRCFYQIILYMQASPIWLCPGNCPWNFVDQLLWTASAPCLNLQYLNQVPALFWGLVGCSSPYLGWPKR